MKTVLFLSFLSIASFSLNTKGAPMCKGVYLLPNVFGNTHAFKSPHRSALLEEFATAVSNVQNLAKAPKVKSPEAFLEIGFIHNKLSALYNRVGRASQLLNNPQGANLKNWQIQGGERDSFTNQYWLHYRNPLTQQSLAYSVHIKPEISQVTLWVDVMITDGRGGTVNFWIPRSQFNSPQGLPTQKVIPLDALIQSVTTRSNQWEHLLEKATRLAHSAHSSYLSVPELSTQALSDLKFLIDRTLRNN